MRAAAAGLALLVLAGCETTPRAGPPTEVPVPVPCVERVPLRPAFPGDGLTGDEDIFSLATTLWADRQARRAYELTLETTVLACSRLAPDRKPSP